MFCKNCGKELKEGSVFCANCGTMVRKEEPKVAEEVSSAEIIKEIEAEVQMEKMVEPEMGKFCPQCGKSLPKNALFCGGCGFSYNGDINVAPANMTEPKKQKGKGGIIALIIALVILVVVGTGLGLYATGVFDSFFAKDEVEEKVEENKAEEKEKAEAEDNIDDEEKSETEKERVEAEDSVEDVAEEKTEEEEKESSKVMVSSTPKISECTAISTLESDGQNTYFPENLLDANPATAWTEGDEDDGVGECVHVYLEKRAIVSKVSILNGYCKDEKRYFNNNRVKEIEIVFVKDSEDGSETVAKKTQILQDNFNSWEDINLAMPIECDRINLFIKSVYPGEEYNDTCISEIKVN